VRAKNEDSDHQRSSLFNPPRQALDARTRGPATPLDHFERWRIHLRHRTNLESVREMTTIAREAAIDSVNVFLRKDRDWIEANRSRAREIIVQYVQPIIEAAIEKALDEKQTVECPVCKAKLTLFGA
jgi:hypothetical protein